MEIGTEVEREIIRIRSLPDEELADAVRQLRRRSDVGRIDDALFAAAAALEDEDFAGARAALDLADSVDDEERDALKEQDDMWRVWKP